MLRLRSAQTTGLPTRSYQALEGIDPVKHMHKTTIRRLLTEWRAGPWAMPEGPQIELIS